MLDYKTIRSRYGMSKRELIEIILEKPKKIKKENKNILEWENVTEYLEWLQEQEKNDYISSFNFGEKLFKKMNYNLFKGKIDKLKVFGITYNQNFHQERDPKIYYIFEVNEILKFIRKRKIKGNEAFRFFNKDKDKNEDNIFAKYYFIIDSLKEKKLDEDFDLDLMNWFNDEDLDNENFSKTTAYKKINKNLKEIKK